MCRHEIYRHQTDLTGFYTGDSYGIPLTSWNLASFHSQASVGNNSSDHTFRLSIEEILQSF